jgi:hypothetical protein
MRGKEDHQKWKENLASAYEEDEEDSSNGGAPAAEC